ncbi:RNA polymerase factor sigma-54 [Alkalihalobacterium chitinilyticum]|uniref:RNA polymerase factor sigma-54 n=1 Tax=Alkalihalobacterium chitinilyticum TaxID=2980103 RepID=A0ABT5VF71_9BACI|nr:RNA polymerase factor sigma-54 [Alkalihalobacterium chitinilyticum]MDE5414113.1 RNA polymerase factor sigma-54 [Alkalihalobacterium chitinilyticum]
MRMDVGLFQQQTTGLYMTKELRQAISLLQYSTTELTQYIQEQALENPLIELEDHFQAELLKREKQREDLDERQWESGYREQEVSPLDFVSSDRYNLQDHLLYQAKFLNLDEQSYEILCYFILHVNGDGYLSEPVEKMVEELGISEEDGEDVLMVLQNMEPTGVGARNLQECLLLQLAKRKDRNILAEMIIENYMQMLAERRWKELSKELSVTLQEIQQVYDLIQTLQPRPGVNYSDDPPKYVQPDVTVEEIEGELVVLVHDDLLPRIQLNKQYQSLLHDKSSDANEYVRKKYDQVKWLLKNIKQRQVTLYQVTDAIVRHQKEFFYKGAEALRPLTLKQIAEEIDVHESTVSRVTTNKYMQSPRGLFELKYFFTTALTNGNAGETSTSYAKEVIKSLIEKEDKRKPLSDQKIVDALKTQHEIELSRRAVAKYRDEMKIPSSSKRKRFE